MTPTNGPCRDIMIDLETLGQTPGCVILSIGAVAFNEHGLGKEYYCVVNTDDSKKAGLFTEPSTIEWWDQQSPQARQVLAQAASKKDSVPLKAAIDGLFTYIQSVASLHQVRIHGNGADFDNAIITCATRAANRELGWKFWNNRCFRTNKAKMPKALEPRREGTYHNALDDAKHQARWAIELHKAGVQVFC